MFDIICWMIFKHRCLTAPTTIGHWLADWRTDWRERRAHIHTHVQQRMKSSREYFSKINFRFLVPRWPDVTAHAKRIHRNRHPTARKAIGFSSTFSLLSRARFLRRCPQPLISILHSRYNFQIELKSLRAYPKSIQTTALHTGCCARITASLLRNVKNCEKSEKEEGMLTLKSM